MNEYKVHIDNKPYHITIEPTIVQACIDTSSSKDISLESTKNEYNHCVQRSERLDNKIYIALTVYAFLFVLICDVIKRIKDFSFPTTNTQLALIVLYSILITANVLFYVYTLIQLTHLLKGVSIERFNPLVVLEKDMINSDSKAVARYICSRYNQCIDYNNIILEKRFQKFNTCVNYMVPIILISISLIFISNFIN